MIKSLINEEWPDTSLCPAYYEKIYLSLLVAVLLTTMVLIYNVIMNKI